MSVGRPCGQVCGLWHASNCRIIASISLWASVWPALTAAVLHTRRMMRASTSPANGVFSCSRSSTTACSAPAGSRRAKMAGTARTMKLFGPNTSIWKPNRASKARLSSSKVACDGERCTTAPATSPCEATP